MGIDKFKKILEANITPSKAEVEKDGLYGWMLILNTPQKAG